MSDKEREKKAVEEWRWYWALHHDRSYETSKLQQEWIEWCAQWELEP